MAEECLNRAGVPTLSRMTMFLEVSDFSVVGFDDGSSLSMFSSEVLFTLSSNSPADAIPTSSLLVLRLSSKDSSVLVLGFGLGVVGEGVFRITVGGVPWVGVMGEPGFGGGVGVRASVLIEGVEYGDLRGVWNDVG